MINLETKAEIINDLANDVPQSEIVKKNNNEISQQSISYLKKTNQLEIEKLRSKLLSKLSAKFIARAEISFGHSALFC